MATVDETYKLALENRNALNLIKDKAKKTSEFPLVTAIDTDLVRVTRAGVSSHTPVSDIRSLSGAGEDNVQSNWDEADGNSDQYIMNKPINLSDFNNDLSDSGGDTPYADNITGILTGGEVTVNGIDNTKFDVAAGTGVVVDWTDPANPKKTTVSWLASASNSVPDITEDFTNVYISVTGDIIAVSGVLGSPSVNRSRIMLQSLIHAGGVIIESVGNSSRPAYEVTAGILDYITEAGAITKGNQVFANVAGNLSTDKTSGTTTLPFINRVNDLQNPTTLSNGDISPQTNLVRVYRDGIGGFVSTPGFTNVDPENYDDGSGVLSLVANNKFTIQRFYFFAGQNIMGVTYGQTVYDSIAFAQADLFTENPELSPLLDVATFVTALIVKKGATNLTLEADAKFIEISISSGGTASASTGDMEKATYDINNNGIVDNSEALNGKADTDFVLQTERYVIPDAVMEIIKAPGNPLLTLEVGDARRGFWDATEYWRFAIYNGGDDTLKASHTIYDYIAI